MPAPEFLQGVRNAVFHMVDCLSSPDQHDQLKTFLHPNLCSAVRDSLESLPPSSFVQVEVASLKHIKLEAVNSVAGMASPDDQHVISWLGQKLITSRKKLKELSRQGFTAGVAREIGLMAAQMKFEFELTVSFTTRERFAVIEDGTGRVVQGSDKYRDAFHVWKFGSVVNWEEDYPLQWMIYDINQFLMKTT